MAVPKKRQSKSRSRRRRAQLALTKANLSRCGKCGKAVPNHTACSFCGNYRGKTVFTPKTRKKTSPSKTS